MPADRTRPFKSPEGAHLSWAVPSPQSIAFATNVTPITFNEPPSLVDAPPEAVLFPPPAECPTGRRPAHSKKKPENHIPRPPNAFILFRSSFIKSQHVSTEVETNHSTLSKIIGLTWQNLPHEERQVWHAKAKAALDEHKRRFPSYAFRPAHTRGKGGTEKRKVREVGPKDVKRCEKIAELLVEGKKGEELDAAIQEFDRTHVPEVITRFEAPLTARMYRRSSSEPAPDTEETKPFLQQPSSSSPSPRSQRVRAASTQPTRNPTPSPAELSTPLELCPEIFFEASLASGYTHPAEYSFAQKIEPSFNFNSFLFDESRSPYDPPTPASVDNNGADMFCSQQHMSQQQQQQQQQHHQHHHQQQRNPAPLSINTSFPHEWNTPPSPFSSSPSTPQLYSQHSSPCTSHAEIDTYAMGAAAADFNLDAFHPPHPSTFDMNMSHHSHSAFLSSEFDALSKGAVVEFGSSLGGGDDDGRAELQLAGQDLDFSAFMSSLHPSTYAI